MLEKKLSDLERSASSLPVLEKELKRLREKTKQLEEDKRVCFHSARDSYINKCRTLNWMSRLPIFM